MAIANLRDLYFEQLRDLYDAEDQIIDALPEMIEGVTSEKLRNAFEEHLEETREQSERLERIFERHDEEASGETCEGMRGLLEEGSEMVEMDGDSDAVDAGIIAAAQRVEHYEIGGYGTARTYAEQLGEDEDVSLLDETLSEEKSADEKLTEIATETINRQAKVAV